MVRIRIGASWKEDPEVRFALRRAAAPARAAEAARGIVDVVAIEVDGVDIAAGRTEGSVLAAAEGLVRGVTRLLEGERQASVHFQDGAVELLLRRRGSSALLSVVTLARPSRVLARDVEVDLEALAMAAREAAAALCGDLAEVQPGAARAAFARNLLRDASRLASPCAAPAGAPSPPARARTHRQRRRRDAPVCGFELRDDEGLIQGYRGPGSDLGSLLAPGRVHLRVRGGEEVLRIEGIPFLLLRDLAAAAGRLASGARGSDSRVSTVLALPGRKATLSVEVDVARHRLSVDGGTAVACDPLALAQALLEAALDFCVAVTARNPRQSANGYLAELSSSASERLAWVRELRAGDLVTAGGRAVRAARSRSAPRAPLGPGRMKRVAFRRAFAADAGAPSGTGLVRTGDLLVACGARATLGLDAATGRARWRLPGSSFAAAAAGALVLASGRRLVCAELDTGRVRWTRPNPGPDPRAVASLGGGIIALVGPGSVVGLDLRSGRAAWRLDPPAATELVASPFGELLIAGADNGLVYAIDRDGRIVWRFRAPGPLAAAPVPWKATALLLCHTPRGGSLDAIEGATGRRQWESPLDFTPSGPPVAFAGLVAVAGLVAEDPVIAAVEPGGSRAWTSASSLGPGPLAISATRFGLAAKTAVAACALLDRAGASVWTRPAATTHPPPGNLPAFGARGLVLVPGEQVTALEAATGAPLGEVPVVAPARLAFDDELMVYAMDAEGAVTAARLATHLSVV